MRLLFLSTWGELIVLWLNIRETERYDGLEKIVQKSVGSS